MKQLKVPEVIKKDPELLKFVADLLQDVYPTLSHCERCGLPWNACEIRAVKVTEKSSTFAVCVDCWEASTIEELKQYYTNVYLRQREEMTKLHKEMEYPLSHLLGKVAEEYRVRKIFTELSKTH